MENIIFGTNWKMSMSRAQVTSYVHDLREELDAWDGHPDVFIMPPYTLIQPMAKLLKDSRVLVGAQNFHWAQGGEFTGEISIPLLLETGAKIVMVGHSERRHLFNEDTPERRQKLTASTTQGLRTVLCLGESLEERRSGSWITSMKTELHALFEGFSAPQLKQIIIAYEPYWAIGVNGIPASTPEIEEVVSTIRQLVSEFTQQTLPILYGGSVDEANCERIMAETSVEGLFVGRAALDAKRFVSIMHRSVKERQPT